MFTTFLVYALTCLLVSFVVLVSTSLRERRAAGVPGMAFAVGISALGAFATCALVSFSTLSILFYFFLGLALWVTVVNLFKNWNPQGQLFFGFLLASMFAYLLHKTEVITLLHFNILGLAISFLSIVCEVFTFAVAAYIIFDILEGPCRIQWREIHRPLGVLKEGYYPKVSLHVPIRDEPVELVKYTLSALARLNYPNYEVIVIDGSTVGDLWHPIKTYCAQLNFKFYHLENHPGYKAGALNFALAKTTKDVELIGIVDADYIVAPNYLLETVSYFTNPKIAFLQTFSDYRNHRESWVMRRIYHFYKYFFDVVMVSLNERNSIIFAGTMGLIRKKVLEEIGGWAEWCITEDAEASLRILSLGYESVYINRSYGWGLMPQTYIDCRRQWFRWVFGNAQIVKRHLFTHLLSRSKQIKLTLAQRWYYLVRGVAPFGSMVMLLSNILLIPVLVLFLMSSIFRWEIPLAIILTKLSSAMGIFAGFLLMLAITWIIFAFKIKMHCSWKQSLVAFSTALSFTSVFAFASWQGMLKKEGVFHRTPKFWTGISLTQSLHAVRLEIALASALGFINALLLYTSALYQLPVGLIFLSFWHLFAYLSAVVLALQSTRQKEPRVDLIWRSLQV